MRVVVFFGVVSLVIKQSLASLDFVDQIGDDVFLLLAFLDLFSGGVLPQAFPNVVKYLCYVYILKDLINFLIKVEFLFFNIRK